MTSHHAFRCALRHVALADHATGGDRGENGALTSTFPVALARGDPSALNFVGHDFEAKPRQEDHDLNTIYDLIGGPETVARLVDAFYRRVQAHPNLSRLFPADITPVRDRQYAFLTQFFGGPHLYAEQYGPPMLRARHLPHPITPKRKEEWLGCMSAALDEAGLEEPVKSFVFERLELTANHMVNSEDPT